MSRGHRGSAGSQQTSGAGLSGPASNLRGACPVSTVRWGAVVMNSPGSLGTCHEYPVTRRDRFLVARDSGVLPAPAPQPEQHGRRRGRGHPSVRRPHSSSSGARCLPYRPWRGHGAVGRRAPDARTGFRAAHAPAASRSFLIARDSKEAPGPQKALRVSRSVRRESPATLPNSCCRFGRDPAAGRAEIGSRSVTGPGQHRSVRLCRFRRSSASACRPGRSALRITVA